MAGPAATAVVEASLLSERDAWVILASTDGIGSERIGALLAGFGSARDVLAAAASGAVRRWAQRQRSEAGRWPIVGPTLELLEAWPADGPRRLAQLAALGLWTVTPLDADYPSGLRDLDPAPPLLIGSGERTVLGAERAVAVVGTRRPTAGGRALAGRICVRLVEGAAVVVSGLAVGIDGAAHAATLERGGLTVAVIGGGHLHPGPRAHAGLGRRIVEEGGAIVSEYPPAVVPSKGTYPRRNRIIAALAQATIVVEAPVRSGALITAHHALELGRLVFVTPGRIDDWATAGSLELLRRTPARIVAGIDALTEDLGFMEPQPAEQRAAGSMAAGSSVPGRRQGALALLDGAQRTVAESICHGPASLDTLVDQTGLAPAAVSGAVTLLLMRGWIQPVGPAYLPAGPLLE